MEKDVATPLQCYGHPQNGCAEGNFVGGTIGDAKGSVVGGALGDPEDSDVGDAKGGTVA